MGRLDWPRPRDGVDSHADAHPKARRALTRGSAATKHSGQAAGDDPLTCCWCVCWRRGIAQQQLFAARLGCCATSLDKHARPSQMPDAHRHSTRLHSTRQDYTTQHNTTQDTHTHLRSRLATPQCRAIVLSGLGSSAAFGLTSPYSCFENWHCMKSGTPRHTLPFSRAPTTALSTPSPQPFPFFKPYRPPAPWRLLLYIAALALPRRLPAQPDTPSASSAPGTSLPPATPTPNPFHIYRTSPC